MTDRRVVRPWNLALVLLASLVVAQPAFAQDLGESSSGSSGGIDNEMPPGDPPKAAAPTVIEEKPVEGSIKDTSPKRRPYGVSLDAYMPWLEGFGGGFKVSAEIPIMHNGFIPSINDSFSLEPRFLLAYQRWNSFAVFDDLYVMAYTPAVAALWSFYFKTNLRLYAFVSLGFTIVDNVNYKDRTLRGLDNRFYHDVGPGIFWDFAQHWALRAEIGYAGMRLGITYLI